MSVAAESRPNSLIGWGTDNNEPATVVEVPGPGRCELEIQPGCPLGATGDWVAYPGGIWTSEAACVSIEVASGSTSATARLPAGERCV